MQALAIAGGSMIGSYRLVRPLGRGGMGEVWLAEHAMLGRRAAVKVLHDQFSRQQDIVTRFFNEARAATAIADPGIVQVFDFGQHSDGNVYIVMELLDGEPLEQRLARRGSLGLAEALRLVRQVAATLGAAHAVGVVHRDIKPDNIFVVRDPEVPSGERTKVLDFGIAKLATPDAAGLRTNTSLLMGTPTYMSPEQCRGAGHVDQRSDIYSLGCVLFQLLVGRVPFVSDASGELIAMHLRETPATPSALVPGLPASVDELVLRCLAKDPALRYASGTDLALAIDAVLARPEVASISMVGLPIALSATLPSVKPTTMSSTASERIDVPDVPAPRKRRGVLAIGVLGAIAAAAIAFAVVRGASSTDDAAAIATTPPPVAEPAPAAAQPPPPPPAEAALAFEHEPTRLREVVKVAPYPKSTQTTQRIEEVPCNFQEEYCK